MVLGGAKMVLDQTFATVFGFEAEAAEEFEALLYFECLSMCQSFVVIETWTVWI